MHLPGRPNLSYTRRLDVFPLTDFTSHDHVLGTAWNDLSAMPQLH